MAIVEVVFELVLEGVSLPAIRKFNIPSLQLIAELRSGPPLRLMVRVQDVPEQQAEQLASNLARLMYFRLLLQFGSRITKSEPPRLVGKSIEKGDSVSATAIVLALPKLKVQFTGTVTSP